MRTSPATGGAGGVIAAGVAVAAVLLVVSAPLTLWLATRRTPWAICARLRRGSGTVRVRLRGGVGVWDPSRALGPDKRTTSGSGTALYRLEARESVSLYLQLRTGAVLHRVGPLVVAPPGAERRVRSARLGAALVVLTAVVGGAVGWWIGGASLVWVSSGVVIGTFVPGVVAPMFRVLNRSRGHAGGGRDPSGRGRV